MLKLLKKALFIVGFILLYFVGIREVRKGLLSIQAPTLEEVSNYEIEFISGVSVSISPVANKSFQYRIPFDSFLLFSGIGLIALGGSRKFFYYLFAVQFAGGVLSTIFLWIGIQTTYYFLVVPDMVARYLLPLSSLGLVALYYIKLNSKGKNER